MIFIWAALGCKLKAAGPVEFEFALEKTESAPFGREIWAEVITPAKTTLKLPAFFVGKDMYAVRVRADAKGQYRLGAITEMLNSQSTVLATKVSGSRKKTVRSVEDRPGIKLDSGDLRCFSFVSGERFVPLGANLAWADQEGLGFYQKAFDLFAQAGLNWARVWMVHWSGMNLDWLPKGRGESPRDGNLDLRVAADWDRLIKWAEEKGIYLQIVLQHHGQYSSQVNTNWSDNPWNVANGGFLKTPAEFFTSPEAIRLSKQKYRYIIARWGYSPAVMAWELFNEVHWVDAMRGETKDEAAVARWHTEMAAHIRSLDRYNHLVTTSTENLNSPLYAGMDYFQPHHYSPNILAGVRHLDASPASLGRPVFYGEVGDDHLPLSEEEKKTGVTIVPPVWASLMGQEFIPAQLWLGRELLATNRLQELAAVARFVSATGFGRRADLVPFSPATDCTTRAPFVLVGGHLWKRRASPEIIVPVDGREPIEFSEIPRIYVSATESKENGYPSRATYHFDFPKAVTLRLQIADTGSAAGSIRVTVDGAIAAEANWPERPKDEKDNNPHPQPDLQVPVELGMHAIVVENTGSTGWFDLTKIDVGLEVPILAAIGQRSDRFIAVWLWHRTGVFSNKPVDPVGGFLTLDDLPPGTWRVTWWDTLTGSAASPTSIVHAGGPLRLPIPSVSRHAAVVLER